MQLLLATEGESDEIVAINLIKHIRATAEITAKRFPARGFNMVSRSISTVVRAGHFGHYDMVVIHFDLNGTLSHNFRTVCESERWRDISKRAADATACLKGAERAKPLELVLMSPCQSTDAWLKWGKDGGDGKEYERASRHAVKANLFGHPALEMRRKSGELSELLVSRMKSTTGGWPISLTEFVNSLLAALAK